MPRSRGGRSAPARRPSAPAAAPARPAGNQQQSRAMTTTAQRPVAGQAQGQGQAQGGAKQGQQGQTQGKSPGLFGQMASTAAGVAIGSSIGHALGGLFGGGGNAAAEPMDDPALAAASGQANAYGQPMDQGYYNSSVESSGFVGDSAQGAQAQGACAVDAQTFRKCMDDNRGDLTICGWYLDQLKACQQAARPY